MKAMLIAVLFALPALAHAGDALPMQRVKQNVVKKVGLEGDVRVRGDQWKLFVPNGPIVYGRGRALELKASGSVNRSNGAVYIKYVNPAAGAAL